MTSCGGIRLLLGPFDDGELEPHEMEDVAFHVVGCGECKAALEDYRALGVALRDVVTVPPLDDFARSVTSRLEQRRIPVRTRVAQWWDSLGRLASVVEFAGVAAATTVLTLLIAGPNVRQFVNLRATRPVISATADATAPARPATALASAKPSGAGATASLVAASDNPGVTDRNLADIIDQGKLKAARDMQEMLADLGAGQSPSVAVWNEPRTDTTVVWVPDQP
jgi:hypothetical protein